MVFDSLDATQKYGEELSSTVAYDFNNQKYTRSVRTHYNPVKQTLHNKEKYRGLLGNVPSLYEATYKLWAREQIEQAAHQGGLMPLLYARKTDLNSQYKKKNQVLFIIQRQPS